MVILLLVFLSLKFFDYTMPYVWVAIGTAQGLTIPWFQVRILTQTPKWGDNMKFLFVVAHPDDEVLGAGGLIYNLIKSGKEVKSWIFPKKLKCVFVNKKWNWLGFLWVFHIIHRFFHRQHKKEKREERFLSVDITKSDMLWQISHFFAPCVFAHGIF